MADLLFEEKHIGDQKLTTDLFFLWYATCELELVSESKEVMQ